MGPVAHHTARATYAKNFFEAGGFEVVGNDGFRDADAAAKAFADSGATHRRHLLVGQTLSRKWCRRSPRS